MKTVIRILINSGWSGAWRGFLLAWLVAGSVKALAAAVTLTPATCTSVAGPGAVNWSNTSLARTSDDAYALATVDGNATEWLQCTNYGFAIPSGSTINGITVNVERRSDRTTNGGSRDAGVRLVKAGVIGSVDRSTTTLYTTSDVTEAHGGATDLWGDTWTPADINSSGFGAVFAATKPSSSGQAHQIQVDMVSITVDYTLPSCAGSGDGLTGSYFIAGGPTPSIPATPTLERTDSTVDFNWGSGSPAASIPADGFAVRWSGQVEAPSTGNYTFCVGADDGVRLWVDGNLVVDQWREQSVTYYASSPIALSACAKYDVVMEYYENGGNAEARLKWATPGASTTCNAGAITIPQSRLYSTLPPRIVSASNVGCGSVSVSFNKAVSAAATGQGAGNPANYQLRDASNTIVPISSVTVASDGRSAVLNLGGAINTGSYTLTASNIADTGSPAQIMAAQSVSFTASLNSFLGEYYANRTLTGPYAAIRADASINFDWSTGSPGVSGVGSDSFSVRWTGTATVPSTGYYTFYTQSDDGVRLFIDTGGGYTQIINNWTDHSTTENASAPIALTAGQIIGLRMEFYENGGYAVAQLRWSAGNTATAYPSNLTNVLSKQVVLPSSQCLSPSSSANAANFDCIESGLTFSPSPARHPLYTKLAGVPFTFDVVALNGSGGIETNYVGTGSKTVTVELFDDSASPQPACSAYASPIASQTLNLVAADAGRKTTGSFTINNAYARLRCRVRDSVPVYGCSTDDFTVRPVAFTGVTSSNANADAAGTSTVATPAIKAGSFFNLSAATGLSGYNGTPLINASLLQWAGAPVGGRAAPGVGAVSGSFSPASAGTASGSNFSYDEVGYFRFLAQGIYDASFAVASGDVANGDCINTAPNDFSNTLIGGKYGCKFGNSAATNHFGRFVPDHFAVTASAFAAGCGTFTYMSQNFATPLSASIEAQNLGNARTQNYSGAFAKGSVALQLENGNSGTPISATRLTNTGAWAGGTYSLSASAFNRGSSVDGPYTSLDVGVTVTDESSSVLLINRNMDAANTSCTSDPSGTSSGTCTAVRLQTIDERYGRFRMANAFGSQLLPLTMMAQTEYYNGTGWMLNADDSCSALSTAPVSPRSLTPGGSTALTCGGAACTTSSTVTAGDLRLLLSAPGTAGYADIALDVPAWLEFAWTGATAGDPQARATFGIYKGNQRLIYRRERY